MPINCSHDRNYWIPEQRVDDIYRILCVGDSMLFGCGVMQDETLPAHLETILNEMRQPSDMTKKVVDLCLN